MTRHVRTTSSRGRDVLEHAIGYVAHVGDLLDAFWGREQTELAAAAEVREAFAALSALVQGHDRRLSTEYRRREEL